MISIKSVDKEEDFVFQRKQAGKEETEWGDLAKD